MRPSGIGGQAVMEGVMMRNGEAYAVAVRKPDGQIEVKKDQCGSIIKWKKLTQIPFVRGTFNFIDSLVLGMKALMFSADFYLEEEEKVEQKEKDSHDAMMTGTVIVAVLLAVGLFVGVPFAVAELVRRFVTTNRLVISVFEGVFRLALFVGYVVAISFMKEIRRVFMYHGAEHKCINCIEQGMELNVENVRKCSKQHKRCGTSFLLFVMLVSIVLFLFIQVNHPLLRLGVRLLMIPVVAGISYEVLKLAGCSDNWLVNLISKPGMWLQNLTTKEPDDDMIEVAIASVEAVFDWKQFLEEA